MSGRRSSLWATALQAIKIVGVVLILIYLTIAHVKIQVLDDATELRSLCEKLWYDGSSLSQARDELAKRHYLVEVGDEGGATVLWIRQLAPPNFLRPRSHAVIRFRDDKLEAWKVNVIGIYF